MADISGVQGTEKKQVEKARIPGVSGDDRLNDVVENGDGVRRFRKSAECVLQKAGRPFKNSGEGLDGLNNGLLNAALRRADHRVACVHQGNAGFAGREVQFVIELLQSFCQVQRWNCSSKNLHFAPTDFG